MTIGAEQQKATPEILARPPKSSPGSAIMKTAQPRLKRPRLRIRDKLLLALLPTATVLPMLGLIDAFGGLHLMCASMASSAFLIYADPRNEMNSVHAVIVSQMAASSVGWLIWLLLGGGFLAATCAIPLAILFMIWLNAVHPPAVSTALAFAMHLDPHGSFVLFAIAVGITAMLVVLQRTVSWLIRTNT